MTSSGPGEFTLSRLEVERITDAIGNVRVGSSGWPRPKTVRIREGQVLYDFHKDPSRAKVVTPGGRMLEDFLALRDGNDDAVLAYVRVWGVLDLHRFDLPGKLGRDCSQGNEPVAAYHSLVAALDTSIRSAQAVYLAASRPPKRRRDIIAERVAHARGEAALPKAEPPGAEAVEFLRLMVEQQVSSLLDRFNVVVRFRWRAAEPTVDVGAHDLPSALVLATVLAVARADGIAVCSSCGLPFVPSARQTTGRRRYCERCRERGVPQRDAQRDARARKRSGTRRTR